MSTNNQLTGRFGEYLAAAELTRRGYFTTPFSGNVPEYDLICVNQQLESLPIQVKTSKYTLAKTSGHFPTKANLWMDIEFNEKAKTQRFINLTTISKPNLLYIMVLMTDVQESC